MAINFGLRNLLSPHTISTYFKAMCQRVWTKECNWIFFTYAGTGVKGVQTFD